MNYPIRTNRYSNGELFISIKAPEDAGDFYGHRTFRVVEDGDAYSLQLTCMDFRAPIVIGVYPSEPDAFFGAVRHSEELWGDSA